MHFYENIEGISSPKNENSVIVYPHVVPNVIPNYNESN